MDSEQEHHNPGQGGGRRRPAKASTKDGADRADKPPESADRAAKRDRLLTTFIKAVAAAGYDGAHIDEICHEVGVSTRQFYEWFGRKEHCYLTAFDRYGQYLLSQARRAFESSDGRWEAQFRAGLETTVGELMTHPAVVQYLLEYQHVQGGGEALQRLIDAAQDIYLTDEARRSAPPVPGPALESIMSSVLVQPLLRYVEEGNLSRLNELVPWIVYYMTLTVFGAERAAAQLPPSA